MKNYFLTILLASVLLISLPSCFHHHDVSVTISDDEDEYEMDAMYKKEQIHDVQVYLNEHLLTSGKISIRNMRGDEKITLDDKTTLYINSAPGELRIRFDKRENDKESNEMVKDLCEDLKDILAHN